MMSVKETVMWVSISSVSEEEQSQNRQTASNPEGPVHSAHSLQWNITKYKQQILHENFHPQTA